MDGAAHRLVPRLRERPLGVVDGDAARVHAEGEGAALAEGERGPLDLVGRQELAQFGHGPGREARTQAEAPVVVPLRRRGRVLRQPAQDRVHEPALPRDDGAHGLAHRRVRGDPGVQELVGAEAQGGARAGGHALERPRGARADRRVELGNVSQRPVHELGHERPIAFVESGPAERRRQEPVGVRALVGDPPHDLEGDGPSAPAHPSRSPGRIRAPRAHSAAVIRLRPAGATSRTSTALPYPAATTTSPFGRTVIVLAPSASPVSTWPCGPRSAARRIFSGSARKVVAAPGSGANARTRRTIASDGELQSSVRSSGLGFGAYVAPAWSCDRGSTAPAANRRNTSTSNGAPRSASLAPSVPASSSSSIAVSIAERIGPVSIPSSINITVTPVRSSPSRIARWTGAAPRHLGRSEKCTFTAPSTGMSRTSGVRISP